VTVVLCCCHRCQPHDWSCIHTSTPLLHSARLPLHATAVHFERSRLHLKPAIYFIAPPRHFVAITHTHTSHRAIKLQSQVLTCGRLAALSVSVPGLRSFADHPTFLVRGFGSTLQVTLISTRSCRISPRYVISRAHTHAHTRTHTRTHTHTHTHHWHARE
jgi:hypothetical protein